MGGSVCTGTENLTPTTIRSLECPACSDSQYQLCYLAHEKRKKETDSFMILLACEIIKTGFDKEMNIYHSVSESIVVNNVFYEKLV